ncbi:MAG: hypothetical protein H7A19_14195 [Rhodanobacteraceae bacterium]|nr:hypothetical protein [Rhodanobacteraceae bacterium]
MTPILLLTASALIAAGDTPTVNVQRDEGSIRLELDLGREVQPYASGRSSDGSLIRTTPAWPWECWISDLSEIHCIAPRAEVPAATPFRVELTAPLYDRNGERLAELALEADTGAPEIRLETRWAGIEPRLVARADQPIDAQSLQSALRIRPEGDAGIGAVTVSPLPEELLQDYERGSDNEQRLFELHLDSLQAGARYELAVDAGVRSLEGPLPGLGDGDPIAIEMPDALYLELNCGTSMWEQRQPPCDPGKGAAVRFHGQPDEASLSAAIDALKTAGFQINGELDRVWGGGYGPIQFQLNLNDLKSSQSYRVVLPALRDSRGKPATQQSELTLQTGQRKPRMTMDPSVVLAPSNPVLWLNGVRRPTLTQLWLDAAGEHHQQRSRPWRWRTPADPISVALPKPPVALTRRGGVEWLRANEGVGRVAGLRLHAPFAVHALTDRKRTWVWLTRWQDAKPLPDAQVDAVRIGRDGQLEVIVEAVPSDSRGLAELVLAQRRYWNSADSTPWLRARLGAQTVYFPLSFAEGLTDSGDFYYGANWAQGELRAFVLTDKPIYKPGERVRFQAWVRRRDGIGAQALDLPASLQIGVRAESSYYDSPVGQEFAVGDGGIVSGELQLPANAGDDYYVWEIHADDDEIESTSNFLISRGEPLTLAVDLLDAPMQIEPGTSTELSFSARYFSGGPAAGLQVGAHGITRPGFTDEVFPDWPGYTFANGSSDAEHPDNCADNDRELARSVEFEAGSSDGEGRTKARTVVSLACDFGILEIAARAELPGLGAAYGPTRRLPLRADRDYLGVRVLAEGDGHKRQARAVLLDGAGKARGGASAVLQISEWKDARWHALQPCTLRADGEDHCELPAGRNVRIEAQAAAARPVTLDDWAWGWSGPGQDQLALSARWDGERLRYRAAHPGSGSALLSIEQGKLVSARVLRWKDGLISGELDASDLPAGNFDLGLLLAPAANRDTPHPQASRARTRVLGRAEAAVDRLSLVAVGDSFEPGRRQVLRMHNQGNTELDVALTVVDDGLNALATDIDAERDPRDGLWREALDNFEPLTATSVSHLQQRSVWTDFEVSPYSNPVVAGDEDFDTDQMETVEVTGSRIMADDAYFQSTASQPGRRAPELRQSLAEALRRFDPVVRRQFAAQAHWQSGLRLAPGETRDLEIALPDNLTAWRAEAVAFASDGQAERQLLTLRSARALEVRPSLPSVVVAGDRVQAGTSIYNGQDQALQASVELHWLGPALRQSLQRDLPLGARATGAVDLIASTPQAGSLQLLAAASAGDARDAALTTALVATPTRIRSSSDSWWLPAGQAQTIDLSAYQGGDSLRLRMGLNEVPMLSLWSQRMSAYPHRCYEQIQSRALAATLLRESRPDLADWVDEELIAAPWRERGAHLDGNGLPVYFDPQVEYADDFLPAYSAWIAARLVKLGRSAAALPDGSQGAMVAHLAVAAERAIERKDWSLAAMNLRSLRILGQPREQLESSWWQARPEFRPLAVAVALEFLAAQPDPERRKALLQQLDEWEAGRTVVKPRKEVNGPFIDHSAAAHCSLVAVIADMPGEQARARRWFDGVASQYGDAVGNDSLALAVCIDAGLRLSRALQGQRTQASVELQLGRNRQMLRLDSAQPRLDQPLEAMAGVDSLRLISDTDLYIGLDATRTIDARVATAQRMGVTLTRTLEVRRGEQWVSAPARLQRGDWVRVRLLLDSPRALDMLSLEESVPGALVPIDTTLQAVADPWIRAQDRSNPWFFVRQLGQPVSRFYATWLPPGRHELSYIAEVRYAGEYAWLPAVLTPMYGRVQRAETAASSLRVDR